MTMVHRTWCIYLLERRLFTVKFNPNGSIARLKARLVAKGYA